MDVQTITTSLEALLHRATSDQGNEPDHLAIDAFCVVLKKEHEGPYVASRLLAAKMHSENPKIALLSLAVLEIAMKKCGNSFHAEIGKFKFLNEMVKLVSPKYLGNRTPQTVKDKVLLLMHAWTFDYPKEVKIKEAYEMLQKQGVIKDDVPPLMPVAADQNNMHETPTVIQKSQQKNTSINFEDEEKSKLLKKLLQSKNPDDLQAANRLIKTMVREDERRAEMLQRRLSDINTVNNNVCLLNEMLEQFQPGITSEDEVQIIKELYTSCKQLQPKIYRLAQETQGHEEALNDILHTSDELLQVFEKYKIIMEVEKSPAQKQQAKNISLLDLDSSDSKDKEKSEELINQDKTQSRFSAENNPTPSELLDIFSSVETNSLPLADNILEPLNLQQTDSGAANSEKSKKISAMDELELLGENLLKSSLGDNSRVASFPKTNEKIPMNLLLKSSVEEANKSNDKEKELDLNILIGDCLKSMPAKEINNITNTNCNPSGDDLMVDLTDSLNEKC